MSTEIHVPELGESVNEATIGKWLKEEGDQVKAGEALVELETDKVNFEVEAEQDGRRRAVPRARKGAHRRPGVVAVGGLAFI